MQVNTLDAQLGLVSKLVDCYRDRTSASYGHLLIDLSPPTDDRLRYRTDSGSIASKFYIPERLKHFKSSDEEHRKSLYSLNVPIVFPQVQKSFRSVLSRRVHPVSLRKHSNSAQRESAKHKKTSRGNVSKRGSVDVSNEQLGNEEETYWRLKKV